MKGTGISFWWQQRGVHEKLLLICVMAYFIQTLLPFLFGFPTANLLAWFSLPGSLGAFLFKPWTILSYAFFHASFSHLFWNMVMLYFGGQLFLNLFSKQRFINVFFLGVLVGGLVFLLSYMLFPVFSGIDATLIGASAGVTAVFIFICTYMPLQEVRVLFFNVKLWQLGVFFIVTDLIQIPNGNAGGHLAHIGGGLLGFIYARQLKKGADIGQGFEKAMQLFLQFFSLKKSPLKTAYKAKSKGPASSGESFTQAYKDREQQKKTDAILDKISQSGYESLSREEKDFLFKSGNS